MRLRRRLQLACVLASSLLVGEARADSIPLVSRLQKTNDNSAGIAFGMDGTWVLDAAFAHRLRKVSRKNFRLQLEARISQPLSLIVDYGGTRLGGTATGLIFASNGLGTTVGLGPDVAFSRDITGARFGFGAEAFLRPGYYGATGAVTFDLGYRLGYATCIIHRQAVEDLYGDRYPGASTGPKDGCVPLASQRFRAGAMFAGVSPVLGGGNVYIAGGVQYSPQVGGVFSFYPLTALPFYLQVGMNMMFR